MDARIVQQIQENINQLGSQSKVAQKCGISPTALSQYLSGQYGADVKSLENKIIASLGIETTSWQIALTRDLRKFHTLYARAKDNSAFVGVSEKAGCGKSASIASYEKGKPDVYVLRAREWTGRMFLDELVRILGVSLPGGYVTIDTKINKICAFFKDRRHQKCQLLIDEADKLRHSALRTLIPIYNECEGFLSVVICGTENLEKEIKSGVRFSRKGYDEIDSRFGRRYLKAAGCAKDDVTAICKANGINDPEKADRIWQACPKAYKTINQQSVEMAEDIRLLKNLILFGL